MRDPVFLLQKGPVMQSEKLACSLSDYPSRYVSFEDLSDIDVEKYRLSGVPVGSVEFTREYAKVVGITLPEGMFFNDLLEPYYHRKVRLGSWQEAKPDEFVKPFSRVKLFTGGIKRDLSVRCQDDTPVLISEPVPFESEFRCYIQDLIPEPLVKGWCRYDDKPFSNPNPDLELVREIAQVLHDNLGPNAYTIDIGWRTDLERYSLIELNDAWALGLYNNSDPQSRPPTHASYADMLVTRWRQILFCSLW